ncbi:MAG: right-handed parallel beta-helix repeat-containing protein, partial [Clostridia bacterium]|nr:right-handed parallel beta-helix repeat-containing protein [Clostridia bacterium]
MISFRDCNTLYVSTEPGGFGKYPDWRYSWSGGPCGSLQETLNRVTQMRGGGMLQPITIKMMAGEYCLDGPISISPTMSNVTIEPYGDGQVIISGSRKITGFEKTTFMGTECVGVHIPEVESGAWSFTDLYVGDLRAERTRLPAQGYFLMEETENPTGELFGHSKWFRAKDADLARFSSLYAFEDAFVSYNHYWIDEHSPIESFDRETGHVTMVYSSLCSIRPGQEYILENVAEQFKNPGEWYLDRAKGMLYYIPRNAAEWENLPDVRAPRASKLLCITGAPDDLVTGVHFKNITFGYTRGDYQSMQTVDGKACEVFGSDAQAVSNAHASIEVTYARNVTFSHCNLLSFGVHGFRIKDGCRSVAIENSKIYDGGAGGVVISGGAVGSPEHSRTSNITVSDCSITHVGRRYFSACGILLMHASECDIIHNDIGDLYYTGVSVGWTWGYAKTVCRDNRIMNNHIWDLGKGFLSDMGGVYLLGSQPGTVVSGNRIHDIKCKDYGGWALYTDEGSAGILLENNLCYRTSSNSYHQHYGTSNVVRNNIFALADDNMLRLTRCESHLSIMFTGNILYSSGKPMIACYGEALD